MEDKTEEFSQDNNLDQEIAEGENEIYTTDICSKNKLIIFGGKNDSAEIYNYDEERTVTRIEDFSDSIIYTKFLPNDRFIVASCDGTIALMEFDKDIAMIDLEDDITVMNYVDEYVVVGTVTGKVYLYDLNLEHINTFGGHNSEIISVDYKEDRILSMCINFLTAHDRQGRLLYTLKANEALAFKYISGDVMCFAREKKIQIFKQTRKLFEYNMDSVVESIELVDKSLVIGGDFEYLLLIDTTGHYGTFKLNIDATVSLINKCSEFEVIFSTIDGLVGWVDIRSIETLKYYNPGVGVIFDLSVSEKDVSAVGENGFGVIKLE